MNMVDKQIQYLLEILASLIIFIIIATCWESWFHLHYSTKPIGPQTRFSDHDDLEIFELKYLKKDHHKKQPEHEKIEKVEELIDEDYEHLDAKLGIKNLDDNYPEFTFQDVPKKEIARKQTFEEYFKDFMHRKEQEMIALEENIANAGNIKYDAACNLELIETLPASLSKNGYVEKMPIEHKSIFDSWLSLMEAAKDEFIMVSQWAIGENERAIKLFETLKNAVKKKDLKVKIIHNDKITQLHHRGPKNLKTSPKSKVEVRAPDVNGKTCPPWKYGILHSKFMVVDQKHLYLGSANFGSRGTTYTKELGILVKHCPYLAKDLLKIFQLYWSIDGLQKLPEQYSNSLSTKINLERPALILNQKDLTVYKVFIGSAPKSLNAEGRTDDLNAILHLIDQAEEFIYIAVNEYVPMDLWKNKKSWPVIDDHLKKAIKERKVQVKFLVNGRATHRYLMFHHFKKLIAFEPKRIEVRVVSSLGVEGFHGSHSKMMVTERAGLIGTSNWTEDYFTATGGVSFVFELVKSLKPHSKPNLIQQMKMIFQRDFDSKLAKNVK